MKKVNVKFVLLQLLILLVIAVIPSVILAIGFVNPVMGIVSLSIMFFVFLNIFYWTLIGRIITDKLARKTKNKFAQERGYVNCETFYSHSEIFMVDVERGKFAYVANQNPFEFQEVSAAEISGAKSGYIPGPLGGTSYVYFEFMCGNKKRRIPTFTSNQPYMLKSAEVLEGLSKADYFCEVINQAKQNA